MHAHGYVQEAVAGIPLRIQHAQSRAHFVRLQIGDLIREEIGGRISLLLQGLEIALKLLIHGVEQGGFAGAESGCRAGKDRRGSQYFHKIRR